MITQSLQPRALWIAAFGWLALLWLGCTAEPMTKEGAVEEEHETIQRRPSCEDANAVLQCKNSEPSDPDCWEHVKGDACTDPDGVPGFCGLGGACELIGETPAGAPICRCPCTCYLPG